MKNKPMRPIIAMTRIVIGLVAALLLASCAPKPPAKIGVMYIVHGGSVGHSDAQLWDSTIQIFSHDPNSIVYKSVIWNEKMWARVLQFGNAPKEIGKYSFEFDRIGGLDPSIELYQQRVTDLRAALEDYADDLNVEFYVDYVGWIEENPAQLAHPRSIYNAPEGKTGTMTYCGTEGESGWENCNPERYNVDGTVERLLNAGVEKIIAIDMTTSGVRFAKTFDVIRISRRVVDEFNAANQTNVGFHWLNDPTDLMAESYPVEPAGWTYSLGKPAKDNSVPLEGRPNPVAEDPLLAAVHVGGITSQFNPDIDAAETGVLLVNHSLRHNNQYFDPKVNDTVVLNRNIKAQLLAKFPDMNPDNIVGGWFGVKTKNPEVITSKRSPSQLERTREMRGENLGHAWMYETDEVLPGDEWGYRYWEALDHLRKQGVKHIVIAFPQIMVDSVLNMVELPNQMGKELGYKNWLYIGDLDFDTYPQAGHPFADYWGIWVTKDCPVPGNPDATEPCCFNMSGCDNGQPYPPPRLTPITKKRNDLDPSLAYDVSPYGHLGYDPALGPASDDEPVQSQFAGTWAMWQPPSSDPRVIELLSNHIVGHVKETAGK